MRLGILRGTFDPLHAGHISFALAAIKEASLDKVYFLTEQPMHKKNVTSLKNRSAEISAAIKNYPDLDTLPLKAQTIGEILPELKTKFGDASLVFLMGSDIVKTLPDWPDLKYLNQAEILIALRKPDDQASIKKLLHSLPYKLDYKLISSVHPEVSSSKIRGG